MEPGHRKFSQRSFKEGAAGAAAEVGSGTAHPKERHGPVREPGRWKPDWEGAHIGSVTPGVK